MNEPAPPEKPEPTPFEKLRAFTAQILAVPKTEIDRREREWREAKGTKKKPNRKLPL